jgi:broad specificity phosphatase PhoE
MVDDPVYLAWRDDPEEAPPGGGERLSDVAARLTLLLARLHRLAPDAAMTLFTHQHGLRAALSLTSSLRDAHGLLRPVPNCAIVHLRWWSEGPELVVLDQSIHELTRDVAAG